MSRSTRARTCTFVMVLLAFARPATAELDILPVLPMTHAPAGSSVVVEALIQNPTGEVVYLGSVSVDVPLGFIAGDAFDDFEAAGPDSLLPGESWEGPVLRLTVAPDAPVASVRQVTLHFSGGVHRYDEEDLAEFTFALNDSVVLLDVDGVSAGPPTSVLRVSPNPTRGACSIAFDLPSPQNIDVHVYDVLGSSIRSLARGRRGAGPHSVTWDGRNETGAAMAPGMYFVRLTTSAGTRRTKVVRMQ